MKNTQYFILFYFLTANILYTQGSLSPFTIKDDKKYIYFYIEKEAEANKIAEFNYIPSYTNLVNYFPNGSIVGFLPTVNGKFVIKRWNDFNHEFVLFFCNALTKKIEYLEMSNGWNFHIIQDKNASNKWIAIIRKGDSQLILLSQYGVRVRSIQFSAPFRADNVKIRNYNNDKIYLDIGMLGREASIEIDLLTGKAITAYDKNIEETKK